MRLQLSVNGQIFELSKIGPEYGELREPVELAPCIGDLIITVDGREHRQKVRLIDGAVPFEPSVRMLDYSPETVYDY